MGIPWQAYRLRPYVAPNLVRRQISFRGELLDFTIDPGTQRWAILDRRARNFAGHANGKTRLADIIAAISPTIATDITLALYDEMLAAGLCWNSMREQRQSSTPVYSYGDPVGLHLEITNACNLSCKHCYVAAGQPLPNEMSDEDVYRAIDLLPPFSGMQLAISGGEPLARKNCMDFVRYAAVDCGHRVDLYTNAWKFPLKFAELIKQINVGNVGHVRIQMSLEGAGGQTNDMIRGVGTYSEAMKSLQMFKRLDLQKDVVLFVCITEHNIHEIDDLIGLAEEHGIGQLVFSQWQRQGHAQDTPWASVAPKTDDWVRAGEKILAYANPNLRVYGNFHGDIRNTVEGRLCLDAPLFPKHVYFFNAFPRITAEGDILADQLWVSRDWFLGNIREGVTLERAFEQPKFHAQLEMMRMRTKYIEECQACRWHDVCEGGSPGHTHAEYGHMNAKDLFCEARMYWFDRYIEHQSRKLLGAEAKIVDAD